MKSLRIFVCVANREWHAICDSLDDVEEAIDDFSSDHCEGVCQLYMKFDGDGNIYPVKIFTEEEC